MATVLPFRGILYNPTKVYDIADVIAPPFDVISEPERKELHDRHPYNSIRLTLGKTDASKPNGTDWIPRAAQYFENWLKAGIIVQDNSPTLYFTARSFFHDHRPVTRFGFIAQVRLEPFEKRIVLPHEKTFSMIRLQRLALMKACRANFAPIFSLYSDPKNDIITQLKAAVFDKAADIDFVDYDSQRHRMWRITDTSVQQAVFGTLESKNIYIADGHHRYTTALNYQEWVRSQHPDLPEDHPANYVMMYLSAMEDPGLIILPAHRLLRELPDDALASLIPKVRKYFDVTTMPFKGRDRDKVIVEFISLLKSNAPKNVIGIFMKDHPEFYLLVLKPRVMDQIFRDEIDEAVRFIDVTVLTRLIFMEILGFDEARMDDEKLIGYDRTEAGAVEAVTGGGYDIAFILNPTQIHQMKTVADHGLIMPRKATYFYPKVGSGLVMNRLVPESM